MKVDGQCHCGAIAYEAEVEPDTVVICHCLDCQRLTGSALRASVPAPARSFRMLRGSPREYVKVGDSGAKRIHAFCDVCGSPLYSRAIENPLTYTLRVGGLNQRDEIGRPKIQIWTKRRLSLIAALKDAPEIEGQPKPG